MNKKERTISNTCIEEDLSFEAFVDYISQEVTNSLGEEYSYVNNTVIKNNGKKLTGLTIRKQDDTISPTFYLEEYYDDYKKGSCLDEIVDVLVSGFIRFEVKDGPDLTKLTDFMSIKNDIFVKVINYSMNTELLRDTPYVKVMDLAAVFYISVFHETMGSGSILIKNSLIKDWNISPRELYDIALFNTKEKLGHELLDIKSVLFNIIQNEDSCYADELRDELGAQDFIPMYVLTNNLKQYGASLILCKEIFNEFSTRINKGLFIIPSSIHELIVIPDEGDVDPEYLKDMVKSVNETQLNPVEILSDNVYYYNPDTGNLGTTA